MTVTKEDVEQLLDRYGNMVLRIAYTYLKNKADAEDIVQEVFLRVIDSNPTFNDENHEKYWLVRTTVNMCKNRLTLFWNRNKCSMDEIGEIAARDGGNADTGVLEAVMSLPQKYRTAVYMFYYEGYSTAETAKLIGCSDSTVRSYLHRARNKLKNILKEDYDFE